MHIKKLEGKERCEAALISAYCFHFRVEDLEAERAKAEADTREDWGAFDEDGTLMAHICNNKYDFYLDGKVIQTGGIGVVSTLPEYRNKGAVRGIFRELLPEACQNGEVLSTLYPFKHEFYRKQGYEVVTFKNDYTLKPEYLSGCRFDGEVCRWNPGDDVEEFLEVYRAFAPKFNLAMARGEAEMKEHLKVEKPYMERKFSYLLRQNKTPVAYVIFTDIRHDPAAILQVEECAWTSRDGFYAILGFLARFEADYGTIRLPLPKGIDLLRIIQTPQAYEIKKETGQGFMVRVINARRLLELLDKPADCDFTVKIHDELIAENNQTLHVWGDRVEEATVDRSGYCSGNSNPEGSSSEGANLGAEGNASEGTPDIELSVRALGQLAVGCINLDEAMLRRDVCVNKKEGMLRRCFPEKMIFVSERF